MEARGGLPLLVVEGSAEVRAAEAEEARYRFA